LLNHVKSPVSAGKSIEEQFGGLIETDGNLSIPSAVRNQPAKQQLLKITSRAAYHIFMGWRLF
jgi:hypothetical protein